MGDLSTKMGEIAGITNEELLNLEHKLNCAKVKSKLLQQRNAELEAKIAELKTEAAIRAMIGLIDSIEAMNSLEIQTFRCDHAGPINTILDFLDIDAQSLLESSKGGE